FLFDTNIFLEILLDQPGREDCVTALGRADADHKGWLTAFSLHAIEHIIFNRTGRHELVATFLAVVMAYPYLDTYATTVAEELEVARLAPRVGLDFDDCLQYYAARKLDAQLVTLDRHFARCRDLTVLHPRQLATHH
ncbi:MAG: type II toxin-antitoxin system VapC family toxin, partial [Deltaproteobacteria bacterium]|nr:type II toxin-antitoxin system VapC family toxin [Deltaproteobacteria bacterium]